MVADMATTSEHRLAAILFTDICGFSRMMEKNEKATLEMMEFHSTLVREKVKEYNGEIIKTIGDAFMISFNNAFSAVRCGLQVQHDMASFNSTNQGEYLILRMGIHLGDIYFFEDDALGEGINIAARLQALAKPGRICISREVYHQVANKLEVKVVSLGEVELKNITRDIFAYEIITESSMDYERRHKKDITDSDRPQDDFRDWRNDASNSGAEKKDTGTQDPNREFVQRQTEEEPVTFEEIKDFVVSQIKQAGRRVKEENVRNMVHQRAEGQEDSFLRELEEKGYLAKVRDEGGKVQYGVAESGKVHQSTWQYRPEGDPYRPYEEYRKKVLKQAEKEKSEFRGHILAYLGVNLFLFFVYLMTGAGFPWFLFPLGGWGIGIVSHAAGLSQKIRHKEEIERYPELDPFQTELIKKIHKSREGFIGHLISNIGVAAFLFMINMITSPGFPWFLFPTVGMGIGVFFHWISFTSKIRKCKKELKRQIAASPLKRRKSAGDTSMSRGGSGDTYNTLVTQAEELRDSIKKQIDSLGKTRSPLGEDMLPLLDTYIDQIRELSIRSRELEEIISGIPKKELQQDLVGLQEKYEQADTEYMKKEYRRSIEEIEHQTASFKELENQKEVIRLRLISSVNSLKQMKIDLARMKNAGISGDSPSVKLLKEKTKDLSHYLEDIETSYRELEEDTGEAEEERS